MSLRKITAVFTLIGAASFAAAPSYAQQVPPPSAKMPDTASPATGARPMKPIQSGPVLSSKTAQPTGATEPPKQLLTPSNRVSVDQK